MKGENMGYLTWMYHDEHEARIFDSEEVPELFKQGWRDSPAKLPVKKTGGKDKN
jgi:hypothetical protein